MMNYNPMHSSPNEYSGAPPVLVAASNSASHRAAAPTIEAAGFRLTPVSIDDALVRLEMQASATAFWIEIGEDCPSLDRLLDRINAEAGMDRFPAIVATPLALIDVVVARLYDSRVEILVDPTPADRAAALAIASVRRGGGAMLHDVASDHNAVRLRQLSDEVGRIAATLARLSSGPGAGAVERPELSAASGDAPSVSGETVRQVIRARRLRARFFDDALFADPAWDMLLDLLAAEIAQHRVPVSSLCIAAAVPATTALRWIKTLTDTGLFLRRSDPHDGRRVFVELSPGASVALRRYFAEVGKVAVA